MDEQRIPVEEEMDTNEKKQKTWDEELSVAGEDLLETLRELFNDATVRKIVIQDEHGKKLLELPLLAGIAGMVVLGPWSAVGLIAAWVTRCSILIERVEPAEKAAPDETAPEAETAEPEPGRCRAITKAGTRCKRTAMAGSLYCSIHQPAA